MFVHLLLTVLIPLLIIPIPPAIAHTSHVATTTLYPGQIPCLRDQYQCDNGQCVLMGDHKLSCDGFPDCIDGSDEAASRCALKCSNGSHSCDGRCLQRLYICDTFDDCDDASDETNCENTKCWVNEFRCTSGNCVPQEKVCNGLFDCKDRSDEPTACPPVTIPICNSSELGCVGGGCVDLSKACDGRNDCPDGSDERVEICPKKCEDDEFKCLDGKQCIARDDVCNRQIECMDGSDEGEAQCATCPYELTFACVSGLQCYKMEGRCDGEVHCMDKSDEMNCLSCKGNATICLPTKHCIRKSMICDNIRDCTDGSDEKDCECPPSWHRCKEAHCIPQEYVCDGNRDCPMGDDEEKEMCRENCGTGNYQCKDGKCISDTLICDGEVDCPHGEDEDDDFCGQVGKCIKDIHWKCPGNGMCIFKEWMCDGTADCSDGEDEEDDACRNETVKCKEDEFRCLHEMKCVSEEGRCDGRMDCVGGSDELGCARATRFVGMEEKEVFVQYRGETYRLCSDNMSKNQEFLCNYLSISSDPDHLNLADVKQDKVLTFKNNYTYYGLSNLNRNLILKSSCSYGPYKLNCSIENLKCGMRQKPGRISPNIINGFQSRKGAWPWYVVLKMGDGRMCGGSVVSQSLIATSACCVSKMGRKMSTSGLTAYVGSTRLDGIGGEMRSISEIILHPFYDWMTGGNNVALLVVEEPIKFNDRITPVCLPDAVEAKRYRSCYIVGFGYTRYEGFKAPFLLETRVNLMTQRECILSLNNTQKPSPFPVLRYVNYEEHLCAGQYQSNYGGSICKGDYGGPLVCESYEGYWELIGIAENYRGVEGCQLSVFTNVKSNLDFLYSSISRFNR